MMMFAATEAIPFTVEVSELAIEVKIFDVIAVVVATTPSTVEVMMLPEVEAVLVVDATMPAKLVVVATPLTVDVSIAPESESAFEFTAVVVPITPLTFEVMTFPDEEKVLLPITEEVAETPLIVVVKTLPESD